MTSLSASDVDTGIRTLDVAHVSVDFSSDETVVNATSAIASTTSTLIGLIPAIARQAQDR
ncbi:MAG: hypothetical protein VW962_04800 [Acidimicrobiaceae bacterium]